MQASVRRLERLCVTESWSEVELVELFALYNDAAYVYFTLDRVADDRVRGRLSDLCGRFFDDDAVDEVLRARLRTLDATEGELAVARREFLAQLDAPHDEANTSVDFAVEGLSSVLAQRAAERRTLLERLGIDTTGISNASVTMDALLASTGSGSTRSKLAHAWRARSAAHADDLVDAVDAVVEARRAVTEEPATRGRRSLVRIPSLPIYLDECLEQSVERHRSLAIAARRATDASDASMLANLTRAMDERLGDPPIALDFDACIAHALRIGRAIDPSFALEHVDDGLMAGPSGEIMIAIVDDAAQHLAPARTETLRNRMSWGSWQQRPVARVRCNLRSRAGGAMTLQAATTLLHELGHAVNHLMSAGRLPFTSGLYYLPIERRECMSMWFEHRVLDDELLVPAMDGDAALVRAVRLRKLLGDEREWLERVVAASIDLALYSIDDDLRSAYDRIATRHGIGDECALDDVAAQLSSQRFLRHPGGAAAYIIGECFARSVPAPSDAAFTPEAFAALRDGTVNFVLPPTARPDLAEVLVPR